MNYAYSAETNMFYPLSLQKAYEESGDWPVDHIEVGEDVFIEFTTYNEGKTRIAGPDGIPSWSDTPPPTKEQLIEIAEQKRQSLRVIAGREIDWRQDAVEAGMATEEETAALSEWKRYRVLLMRVDTSAVDVKWPSAGQ